MSQYETQEFATSLGDRLRAAGLKNPERLSAMVDTEHFGNAEATFRVGSLILRIVRDRDEEFLSVAFGARPDQFYLIDDIELAMGWKTLEDVTTIREAEQLDPILSRIAERFVQLVDKSTGERECLFRARIERASRDRSEAFINHLNRISDRKL